MCHQPCMYSCWLRACTVDDLGPPLPMCEREPTRQALIHTHWGFARMDVKRFRLGKAICYLGETDQLLTHIFSTSIAPHPSIFSNSGEIPVRSDEVSVRVRVPGLGFGISGGCCSPPAIEGGPVAAGRPGGGRD
jgi:hypothetical protein